MRRIPAWLVRTSALFIVAMVIAFVGCSTESATEKAVDEAVAGLADTGKVRSEALDSLRSLPNDRVIPDLVAAIDSNPRYRDVYVRTDAFSILRQIGGQNNSLGRALFIRTLSDTGYHMSCLKALAKVDSVYRDEVATAVWPYAGDSQYSDPFRSRALWLLNGFRYHRPEMYDLGYALLKDSTRDDLLRQQGARAMLENGDLDDVLDIFGHLTPTGLKVSLWALAVHIDVHPEMFDGESGYRERMKELIVKSLHTPDPELRKGALDAIAKVYGPDLFVTDSDAYVLNPELKQAMKYAVRHEKDQVAVRRIEGALRELEGAAERVRTHGGGAS